MRIIRHIGSAAFVLGLFVMVFGGLPWHVLTADDPAVPAWLQAAIFCLLGGILVVLLTVAIEQKLSKAEILQEPPADDHQGDIVLLNSDELPDRRVSDVLGLVQGHTVFAIWLGKDLSALVRLILGGELTEYTEMMGRARAVARRRMAEQARELGADAVLNVRFMTTSVVGAAAELLAYGTAVRLAAPTGDA